MKLIILAAFEKFNTDMLIQNREDKLKEDSHCESLNRILTYLVRELIKTVTYSWLNTGGKINNRSEY